MAIGYKAEQIIEQLREEVGTGTARPIQSLARDEQDILRRLIERTALQIVAKAIELNNAKIEQDLQSSSR
jgi:hypothetical protein